MASVENLTLIVKAASVSVATDAAAVHGLVEETRPRFRAWTMREGQVRIDVPLTPSRLALAATWFCEPGESIEGQGYPEGSLLFYR